MRLTSWIIVVAVCLTCWASSPVRADETKLPEQSLEPLKTLNDYHPFTPPESPEQWDIRREQVRRQLLVANGLWPLPTRTPLSAIVHGKVDRTDYTVERVYFEAVPGFYVTGSLYRPKGYEGKRPAVLSPHGHWANGRFYDAGEKLLQQELFNGAERFDPSGRFPIQARCVQLARMGCIVFQYDMIGYADSQQIQHRPGYREHVNTDERWGFFSPNAELNLQNMMGLQTWSSIRALDWLSSLDDVDTEKLAVTGASGGGTQTMMLTAIDDRIDVSMPCVMVSTAMQGGCTCENACYLRIGTGNVEFAALTAPRPLGMAAADDWTVEMETKGFPELQQLYEMLGVKENVTLYPHLHFGHNYNYISRGKMYEFMNRHLKLGFKSPIVAGDFIPLTREEATVWNAEHPAPPSGDDVERDLLEWFSRDSAKQLAAVTPTDEASLQNYRDAIGGALDVMLVQDGQYTLVQEKKSGSEFGSGLAAGGYWLSTFRTWDKRQMAERSYSKISEQGNDQRRQRVIWLTSGARQPVVDENGEFIAPIKRLLEAGVCVTIPRLSAGPLGPIREKQRLNKSNEDISKRFAGYTFGYNSPEVAEHVADVIQSLEFHCPKKKPSPQVSPYIPAVESIEKWPTPLLAQLRYTHRPSKKPSPRTPISVIAIDGAAKFAAPAIAQLRRKGIEVDRVALDTVGFRFADVEEIDDADFWPGAVKYGDLPAMVALGAPTPLWLSDGDADPASLEIVRAAYRAADAESSLTIHEPSEDRSTAEAAVDWLLRSE